ncbi:TonB-dependent receptor [Flavobacterium pectinovorum]|uniref:Iron complex outermembrane recepter protein n=1 Tax=Flavobacterium pectinovorum TaxID=29533 RepID=A0AB36P1W9_9FLAO|nr:TonB-dependent receptor [Flavobacterium pectinovorum]OXB05015.1 TonB-dependent siderophore receptor [Flavobacterium pectinovorum]SHL31186.1 iron complex outermembrane recepter protein [Flavobacterium pectinovorum]
MKYLNLKTSCFLSAICLLFSISTALAQQTNGKIKGTITTSEGDPAAGVNVVLKNSKYGTVTNDDGTFELNRVKPNTYSLQISLTGYETTEQEVVVAESETANVNLQLKVSNKELQEVVINRKKSILSKKTDYVARMPLKNLENPQVYSVIHKELLLEQVAVNIETAIRNSPGAIPVTFPSGGIGITFRGFTTGVNARNGMETASGRSSIDLSNVERIEIMKGPSGTLFGSSVSSFGGVVNLVTKKPFETAANEVSYTTGSFNTNRLTADINTPLNKDKTVLFRINMAVNREKSFLDYGFNNTLAISPSLTYKASDKLTFNIDAELFNVNNTRRTYNTYTAASGITNPTELKIDYKKSMFHDDNDAKTSATKIFAQAEYEISENWKSTTVFSFVDENVERSYQSYAVWSSPTQVARRVGLWGPVFNTYTNIQENINGQFATGSIKHKLLVGGNYRLYSSNFSGGTTFTLDNIDVTTNFAPIRRKAVDAGLVLTTIPVADQETISFYACDVVNFTDKLSAMLSLRLDNFNREKVGTTEGYHQTALSPKLGLVYEIIKDQVSVFGNYMNGFQNSAPVTQPDLTQLVLDPIYAVQYEGGIKAEAFNKKLSATASYYNIKIDNATRTDAAGVTYQDGVQESKGVDLELIANPFSGLNIVAGYAYNENKILKASDASIEGNIAAGAPKNVVNFWTTYTLQNTLKGLGAGFGANYVDKSYFATDNNFYMPSYTTYNATFFYDQSSWRVGVKFNNMSNKKYWDFYGNSQAPSNLLVNLTIKF